MKTVKINVDKLVENAFYTARLGQDIALWLYGKVSIIGCYHPSDYQNPYHYFAEVEYKNTKQRIGIFNKDETFTESDFNRILTIEDYLWWDKKVFLLLEKGKRQEIVELYGICDGKKLSQAFPATETNPSSIKLCFVKSVDGKKNFGHYWDTPYRDLIPFSPITQEPIKKNSILYQTEEVPIFDEGFIGFYRFGIDWEYLKNNNGYPILVGYPNKYKKDNQVIYFKEILSLEDEDSTKSFQDLGFEKNDVLEFMKKLDFQYDIDFNIEETDFSTPQKLQDFVSECLNDRIFA